MAGPRGTAIVVGAGIAGLRRLGPAAARLRGRGVRAGADPQPRATSHDEHRITRHAYGSLEGYAYLDAGRLRRV